MHLLNWTTWFANVRFVWLTAKSSAGIRDYFNSMLGKHLLYKFERPQYAQILEQHKDKKMSEIYGAIHLLRMFSLLGRFLAYTPLDEKNVQLLLTHLHDFLRFVCRNDQYCSMCEYAIASPDYHRRAMWVGHDRSRFVISGGIRWIWIQEFDGPMSTVREIRRVTSHRARLSATNWTMNTRFVHIAQFSPNCIFDPLVINHAYSIYCKFNKSNQPR